MLCSFSLNCYIEESLSLNNCNYAGIHVANCASCRASLKKKGNLFPLNIITLANWPFFVQCCYCIYKSTYWDKKKKLKNINDILLVKTNHRLQSRIWTACEFTLAGRTTQLTYLIYIIYIIVGTRSTSVLYIIIFYYALNIFRDQTT